MKAHLVVVQGKPEGKTIPLALPQFKIGRGEGCQLRPNNDQVSREHAMFEISSAALYVQDLGSRNGTEVNGKKLTAHEPFALKSGDLVTVGPLTFAVSIEGAPIAASASSSPAPTPKKLGSLDDVSNHEIDAWLVSDASKEPPDRPSGVYGGDTLTFESFKLKEKPDSKSAIPAARPSATPVPAAATPIPAARPSATPVPAAATPIPAVAKAPVPQPGPEPETVTEAEEPVEDEIEAYQEDDGIEDLSRKVEAELDMPEDMVDESNPFYVKKKAEGSATTAAKGPQKDSSDAANDILRRMMDRRKASKSS